MLQSYESHTNFWWFIIYYMYSIYFENFENIEVTLICVVYPESLETLYVLDPRDSWVEELQNGQEEGRRWNARR